MPSSPRNQAPAVPTAASGTQRAVDPFENLTPEETAAWREESARGNPVLRYLERMSPAEGADLEALAASDAADEDENVRQIFAALDRGEALEGPPEEIARLTAAWQLARAAKDTPKSGA